MAFRSCLTNPTASFVADTSVAINLNATGCAETILSALSNRFLVVEQVLTELESGRENGAQGRRDSLSACYGGPS